MPAQRDRGRGKERTGRDRAAGRRRAASFRSPAAFLLPVRYVASICSGAASLFRHRFSKQLSPVCRLKLRADSRASVFTVLRLRELAGCSPRSSGDANNPLTVSGQVAETRTSGYLRISFVRLYLDMETGKSIFCTAIGTLSFLLNNLNLTLL